MRATRCWTRPAPALLLATLVGGCAPAGLRPNIETPLEGPQGALTCPTLTQPTDTMTIGAEGGRLSADGHSLTVPSGALPENQRQVFMMIHPARDYVVVTLEPDGQQFAQPARLTLSYAHCRDPETALAIYRWDPPNGWTRLESRQDTRRRVVETELRSLSSYALGAE